EVGLQQRFGLRLQGALGLGAIAGMREGARLGVGAALRGPGERRHRRFALANFLGILARARRVGNELEIGFLKLSLDLLAPPALLLVDEALLGGRSRSRRVLGGG
ncbi:MAG TPA: hypothetical protein VF348_07945, partial [Usitatibacter sp.]